MDRPVPAHVMDASIAALVVSSLGNWLMPALQLISLMLGILWFGVQLWFSPLNPRRRHNWDRRHEPPETH